MDSESTIGAINSVMLKMLNNGGDISIQKPPQQPKEETKIIDDPIVAPQSISLQSGGNSNRLTQDDLIKEVSDLKSQLKQVSDLVAPLGAILNLTV